MSTIELFLNQTTDANSLSFFPSSGSIETTNRKSYLEINGTIGSTTITLQTKDPLGNWHTTGLSDELKLATDIPGVFIINYSDEVELRLSLTVTLRLTESGLQLSAKIRKIATLSHDFKHLHQEVNEVGDIIVNVTYQCNADEDMDVNTDHYNASPDLQEFVNRGFLEIV